MKKTKLFFIGLLILFITGCSNNINQPVDNSPEKLTPYSVPIDLAELKNRRNELLKKVPANSLIIVTTNDASQQNSYANYGFRPSSSFYYLTGFEEPNATAIIRKKAGTTDSSEMIMFVEERDSFVASVIGPCYGSEGVIKYFNADSAYNYKQFQSKMTYYLNSGSYTNIYANFYDNKTVSDLFYATSSNIPKVTNLGIVLNDLRVIKSANEIDMIQKAVNVSVQAFLEAMR